LSRAVLILIIQVVFKFEEIGRYVKLNRAAFILIIHAFFKRSVFKRGFQVLCKGESRS
jgi:hypothetical protein